MPAARRRERLARRARHGAEEGRQRPGPCGRAPPRCRWRCRPRRGARRRSPAPTLSASRPPERISGDVRVEARELPVERLPRAAGPRGEWASSRWKSVFQARGRAPDAASRTRAAFITRQPVRRAASRQYAGPSSPWSWSSVSERGRPARPPRRASRSRRRRPPRPRGAARRRSPRLLGRADARAAGPEDHARPPRRRARRPASASSREVTPQILIRVTPQWSQATGATAVRQRRLRLDPAAAADRPAGAGLRGSSGRLPSVTSTVFLSSPR